MSKITLISKNKRQYKANMHCHSTLSDGKLSPEELKALYKSQGYDILAITDHCYPKNHSEMTEKDFLLLTGYEAYIRPTDGFVFDRFGPEVHLNLFAKEPDNEKLICYNKESVKYIPDSAFKEIKRVGSERKREYSTEYINEFIKTANDNGYIVSYNHSAWSMEDDEHIFSYQNLHSFEMYNTSSFIGNNIENGELLYDKMLRRGMHIGCHAGDDNHNKHPLGSPYNDSCGWYTVFLADKLEYSSVFSALENKDYYASNGPAIYELSIIDGETVHLECSPAESAFIFYGSVKIPASVRLARGDSKMSFDFPLNKDAKFIRVSIYDSEGKVANSRGFFPEEWSYLKERI